MLVITMTIIGLIGASIASLMGAKHKELPFQVNSYNTLNLANAGVEWARRYFSDGPAYSYFNNRTVTLGTLGTGSFTVTYTSGSDVLTSVGNYQGVSRRVDVSQFRRRFVGKITIWPGSTPNSSGYYIYIRFINNGSQSLTVERLTIIHSGTGALDLFSVWNYAWDWVQLYWGSVNIPANNPRTITLTSSSSHNTDAFSWYAIGFWQDWALGSRSYTITFLGKIGGTDFTSTIKFSL